MRNMRRVNGGKGYNAMEWRTVVRHLPPIRGEGFPVLDVFDCGHANTAPLTIGRIGSPIGTRRRCPGCLTRNVEQ